MKNTGVAFLVSSSMLLALFLAQMHYVNCNKVALQGKVNSLIQKRVHLEVLVLKNWVTSQNVLWRDKPNYAGDVVSEVWVNMLNEDGYVTPFSKLSKRRTVESGSLDYVHQVEVADIDNRQYVLGASAQLHKTSPLNAYANAWGSVGGILLVCIIVLVWVYYVSACGWRDCLSAAGALCVRKAPIFMVACAGFAIVISITESMENKELRTEFQEVNEDIAGRLSFALYAVDSVELAEEIREIVSETCITRIVREEVSRSRHLEYSRPSCVFSTGAEYVMSDVLGVMVSGRKPLMLFIAPITVVIAHIVLWYAIIVLMLASIRIKAPLDVPRTTF